MDVEASVTSKSVGRRDWTVRRARPMIPVTA
jgi:hypothetical protein